MPATKSGSSSMIRSCFGSLILNLAFRSWTGFGVACRHGQVNHKGAAFAGFALDGDGAAVHLDNPPADRQAQPATAHALRVAPGRARNPGTGGAGPPSRCPRPCPSRTRAPPSPGLRPARGSCWLGKVYFTALPSRLTSTSVRLPSSPLTCGSAVRDGSARSRWPCASRAAGSSRPLWPRSRPRRPV